MIGYSCKYAPLELIAAYGGEALMLDAETEDFSRAETLTHANVCCHAKALLTQALDISELVLTDCCDATRRTYDVLESEGRQQTSRLSRYSARASAPSFWGRSAAHSPSRWKT